jgi:hypothetical protein
MGCKDPLEAVHTLGVGGLAHSRYATENRPENNQCGDPTGILCQEFREVSNSSDF